MSIEQKRASADLQRAQDVIALIGQMMPLAERLRSLQGDPNGLVANFLDERRDWFQRLLSDLSNETVAEGYRDWANYQMSGRRLIQTKSTEVIVALITAAGAIISSETGKYVLERAKDWLNQARGATRDVAQDLQAAERRVEELRQAQQRLQEAAQDVQQAAQEAATQTNANRQLISHKSPGAHGVYR